MSHLGTLKAYGFYAILYSTILVQALECFLYTKTRQERLLIKKKTTYESMHFYAARS